MMLGLAIMALGILFATWMGWVAYRQSRSWRIGLTVFAAVISLILAVVDHYDPPRPFMCIYHRIDMRPILCLDILDILMIKTAGLILVANADKISRLLRWP